MTSLFANAHPASNIPLAYLGITKCLLNKSKKKKMFNLIGIQTGIKTNIFYP